MIYSESELKALEALLRKDSKTPQFWDSTFRIPAGYLSWGKLREFYLSMWGWNYMSDEGQENCRNSITYDIPMAQVMGNASRRCDPYGYPFYVVSKALIEALEQTDIDGDLDIDNDCPMPFPSFTFLLPKGALDIEVMDHDNANRMHQMGVMALHLCRMPVTIGGVPGEGLTTIMHDGDAPCGMGTFTIRKGRLHSDIDNLDPEFEPNRAAAEKQIKLVMKLLATMAAAPELLDPITTEGKRKAKRNKREMTFLTPRYLGLRYRHERSANWQGESTHEARRTHWRRGYLRRQKYGPGWSLTRTILIRPVMVNARGSEAPPSASPGGES